MWSSARLRDRQDRQRMSLAGQFLALQLAVLLLALLVTSVVSVRQSDAEFRQTRGARLRAGAENLAGTAIVRRSLSRGEHPDSLAFYAEQMQDNFLASWRLHRPARRDESSPAPTDRSATRSTSRPAT